MIGIVNRDMLHMLQLLTGSQNTAKWRGRLEVRECECGCDGECGSAMESVYQFEPERIDRLIAWMGEYAKERMEKGKNDEGEEQLEGVFWVLSELYADCDMSGEQRARFEDACSCVSGLGWPWEKYGQTDGGCGDGS